MTIILWYQKVSGYYRDKVNGDTYETNADNYGEDNRKTVTSTSFEYKTKIIGNKAAVNSLLEKAVVVPINVWVIYGDLLI